MMEDVMSNSETLNFEIIFNLLNYSSDEIFILDKNKKVVYVNKKCEAHYGLKQQDVLGMNNLNLVEKGYWAPSIVPLVFRKKKPIAIKQQTYLGTELLTRAIPVLNNENTIEYIFITATEINAIKRTLSPNEEEENKDTLLGTAITNNYQMKELYHFCDKISPTNSTVLIQGESGTGKGVLANYIHQMSDRKNERFITINCAALPKELIESELFGYEKGSFTGAIESGKEGLFQTADKGTIFLDEISEMDISLQAKLLHVIQDKTFRPVGSNELKKVDVRIIAATNKKLQDLVSQEAFREDLYYRLSVIDLQLPPLRERTEDIVPFIYMFLNKSNKTYDTHKIITEKCISIMKRYSWPGNIRQIENIIERLVITSGDNVIKTTDLPRFIIEDVQSRGAIEGEQGLDFAIDNLTSLIVRQSYRVHQSSRKVAKDLNISQSRASRLIRRFC